MSSIPPQDVAPCDGSVATRRRCQSCLGEGVIVRHGKASEEDPWLVSRPLGQGWMSAGCGRCGGTGVEPEERPPSATFRCPLCAACFSYRPLVCGTERCEGVPQPIP